MIPGELKHRRDAFKKYLEYIEDGGADDYPHRLIPFGWVSVFLRFGKEEGKLQFTISFFDEEFGQAHIYATVVSGNTIYDHGRIGRK